METKSTIVQDFDELFDVPKSFILCEEKLTRLYKVNSHGFIDFIKLIKSKYGLSFLPFSKTTYYDIVKGKREPTAIMMHRVFSRLGLYASFKLIKNHQTGVIETYANTEKSK